MTREEPTFRTRAFVFAGAAAVAVSVLALSSASGVHTIDAGGSIFKSPALHAVLFALLAAAVTALATLCALQPVAAALDRIVATLRTAADGDLSARFDGTERAALPGLAEALDVLLQRFRTSLDRSEQLALTDALTGLPNRVHFERIVEAAIARAATAAQQCALLFIDLDRFKSINDNLGHARGDLLVAMVASRLRQVDREGGGPRPVVARLSGDEFAVLLPATGDPADIERAARRVLQAFEPPFHFDGQTVKVGASIGVASFPQDGGDLETLLRNADAAMYHAKDRGRGQLALYAGAMGLAARERLQLEIELKEALRLGQFELHYQPQVAPDGLGVVGVEALVRWRHPTLGMRPPGVFIPLAEETGLIADIGKWVAEEAIRTVARWKKRGLNVRMSFNVSPRQLARGDFTGHIRHCMVTSGAPASLVEIEITESLVMSNDAAAIERLAAIRSMGLSIAIDDFGTGYSNLARLKQLPIDRLKIDRSLVEDVATCPESRTIVEAILGLAHGLGYEVVAEGIETADQQATLCDLGCDLLQGYGIARPADEARFLAWHGERRMLARTG